MYYRTINTMLLNFERYCSQRKTFDLQMTAVLMYTYTQFVKSTMLYRIYIMIFTVQIGTQMYHSNHSNNLQRNTFRTTRVLFQLHALC